MKKYYTSPVVEIIKFSSEEVFLTGASQYRQQNIGNTNAENSDVVAGVPDIEGDIVNLSKQSWDCWADDEEDNF